MKNKKMIIMLAGSALVFGSVFGYGAFRSLMMKKYFANMQKPEVSVTVAPVVETNWSDTLSSVGTLKAVNGVDVTTQMAGMVAEIAFESGQTVKQDDELVRLDTREEEGNLQSAKANLHLSQLTLKRTRDLTAKNTLSQAALDAADADTKVKEATVAIAQAQLDKKIISAPFDGMLGVRLVDLGQYLQPGQAVANLQDTSSILCDFSISQKDIDGLAPGLPVKISVDTFPGQQFEGTLTTVSPQVDPQSGMIALEAKIPNTDNKLRPGMFASIQVELPAQEKVMTVPEVAISYNLFGDSLFVVKDGKDEKTGQDIKTVDRIVVDTGERRNGEAIIRSGIKAGDMVVTSGQLKLDSGTKIKIEEGTPLKEPTQFGPE